MALQYTFWVPYYGVLWAPMWGGCNKGIKIHFAFVEFSTKSTHLINETFP